MVGVTKNYKNIRNNSSTYIFFGSERMVYKLDKSTVRGDYYHCIEKGCPCRGKIVGSLFQRTKSDVVHNHENNHELHSEYKEAYSKLKELVATDQRPIRDLHKEFLRSVSLETAGKLAYPRVYKTLQRIRHKQMPPCKTLDELINLLEFNDDINKLFGMIRNHEFYQGAVDENLVFANRELISKLGSNVSLYIDGTFKVVPFKACQLLIILAELQNTPRPICYVVMTGRKEIAYRAVLQFIRDGVLSYDGVERIPNSVLTDFEKGLRKAVLAVWPDTILNGCNFHFSQAIRRKASKIKSLSTRIFRNSKHHTAIKMFMRLSLLPRNRVVTGYKQLERFIISSPSLRRDFKSFIKYFKWTWFGRFGPHDWCVGNLARRTNNNIEGYNRFVKDFIPLKPAPYVFLDGLLNLAHDASSKFESDRQQNSQRVDRSQISGLLDKCTKDLEEGTISELTFLKKMALNTNIKNTSF